MQSTTDLQILSPQKSELENLSSDDLIQRSVNLAASERKLYTEIIQCLEEIERRRLYHSLGYSSLYSFCTDHLHYSAAAAQRRISSMRLIKTFAPADKKEVAQKISDGGINLSHLSRVAQLARQDPKKFDNKKKLEIIHRLENTNLREAEACLVKEGLDPLPQRERFQKIGDSEARLSFHLNEEGLALLQRFLELSGHTNPWVNKTEAIHQALRIAVEKLESKKFGQEKDKARANLLDEADSSETSETKVASTGPQVESLRPRVMTRYIESRIRQEVWRRDRGRCQFPHPVTGSICGSRFALEIDHIEEFGFGGSHDLTNLRLLCRAHNLYRSQKLRKAFIRPGPKGL
jgi:hypothetical protein